MPKAPHIVLIPGHGIGPEILWETVSAMTALRIPLGFFTFRHPVDENGLLRPEVIESIRTHGVALKGPLATPIGEGHESINVQLRRALDLYANVRPIRSFPGTQTRYRDIDIIIIRENLEGLYSGVEFGPAHAREVLCHPRIAPSAAVTCSTATPEECERISEFAFRYAVKNKRQKMTIVHKANIDKLTDGMFLSIARAVGKKYPAIKSEDFIIDNFCTELVSRPQLFDIVLCPNHWGDIVSAICAGMTGGLGLAPSGQEGKTAKYHKAPYINEQFSDRVAVFEAVHGTAPNIVGMGIANPAALMLSAALMLDHLGYSNKAKQLEAAVTRAIRKERTRDLGGTATTKQFTNAVIQMLTTAKK